MITDHLRKVIDRLSQLPAPIQDQYATAIEIELEQAEQAEQAASPADEATPRTFTSTLDLAGIITDPSVTAMTARQIDELLADETGGRHDAAE